MVAILNHLTAFLQSLLSWPNGVGRNQTEGVQSTADEQAC